MKPSADGVLQSVLRVSGTHVVNGLLGIAFVPIALRRLGDAGYGALSVYWFMVGYLVLIELGVGKNLVREVAAAADTDQHRLHVQNAVNAYLVIAVVVIVLGPLLAWVVPRWVIPFQPSLQGSVGLLVLLAAADYLSGIFVSLHTAEAMVSGRFTRYAWFQSMSGLLRYGGGLIVLLTMSTPTPVLVGVAFVARRIVEIPLAVLMLGRLPEGTWSTWRPSLRVGRTFARSSSLSLAQLLQTSVTSAGSVLIGHLGGPAALGLFRACFDLASKLWFISNAFGLVLFPRFAHLQASEAGRRMLAAILPATLTASATLLTIIGVVGALVAAPILVFLGVGGDAAWAVFALSLAGVALHAHGGVPFELLQASGRFREAAFIVLGALAGLLVTFTLLLSFPPLLAISWAWFLSQVIYAAGCRQAVAVLLSGGARDTVRKPVDEVLAAAALAAAAFAVLSLTASGRLAWTAGSVAVVVAMLYRVRPIIPILRATS
jgi:O-antigen/teichoic acid export membrane protein